MEVIRLDMTISLDGYVTWPQDSTDDPMGIGGFRLFNWLDRRHDLDAGAVRVAGEYPGDHPGGGLRGCSSI
jgi:hypothetical protein